MKEKNRFELKEMLEQKHIEQARYLSYNPKRAARVTLEIEELKEAIACAKEEEEVAPRTPTLKERLYAELAPLDCYLKRGASKKRFFPLFTRHPKVILAQMIHLAAIEARSIPKKIAPYKKGPFIQFCDEIETFCQTLIDHSEKRWNHALYNGEFLNLYEKWSKLLKHECLILGEEECHLEE